MALKRYSILISLILAGEAIFFLPFVMARVFRASVLEVFELSNTEIGLGFSLYGMVAIISYVLGGFMADRYSAKKLISAALISTSFGGILLASFPSEGMYYLVYSYWGFSTIFLFWAALQKATSLWGSNSTQGLAFGLVESGRGLSSALFATLAVFLFQYYAVDSVDLTSADRNQSYFMVMKLASALVFLIGIVVYWILPDNSKSESISKIDVGEILPLLGMRNLWIQALIVFTAYLGYKATDDLSLYAREVLEYSEIESASFGQMTLYLRPLMALLAGVLLDRVNSKIVLAVAFGSSVIGSFAIYAGSSESYLNISVFLLGLSIAGIYGLRGVYLAIMKELNLPKFRIGTAIGLISIIGYLPDVFMSPLMGYFLDNFQGAQGHRYVFGTLGISSTLGLVFSLLLKTSKSSSVVSS